MTVEHVTTGVINFNTFSGAGSVSSSQAGTINTDGTNRLVVIAILTGRSQANGAGQTTSVSINSITASGLTFTKKLGHTWNYIPPSGNSSFPNACMSLDVFTAPASAQQTSKAWSSTLSGDQIQNNQFAYVFSIAGLPDINNADAMTPLFVQDYTGTATHPVVPGVSTTDEALVLALFFARDNGFTYNLQSGYTGTQLTGTGDATSTGKFLGEYKDEPSPLINASIGDSTGTTPRWTGAVLAFGARSSFMAAIEAKDSFSAVGYGGEFGKVGDLTATEAKDTMTAAGYPLLNGLMLLTEGRDTFSAFGRQPQTGAFAATEARDRFTGTGIGLGEDGTLIVTEAADIAAFEGTVPISGNFTPTEVPDKARIIGQGVSQVRRRRYFNVT